MTTSSDQSTPFEYQSSFTLDKTHFAECYEESVTKRSSRSLYAKAIILILVGAALVLFSDVNGYAAWFIFSLGILEVVSTYYRKPWWVMRQMLSKAAKSKVTIEMTDEYIRTFSFYADNMMRFEDINAINKTQQGWLISHTSGLHYISDRCLSDAAIAVLKEKSN